MPALTLLRIPGRPRCAPSQSDRMLRAEGPVILIHGVEHGIRELALRLVRRSVGLDYRSEALDGLDKRWPRVECRSLAFVSLSDCRSPTAQKRVAQLQLAGNLLGSGPIR